ncbi:unnamed protein product [Pedinophyceae sp. YPF-701]|nr:unnamed protein product [Pedinophyceae sp. YPF-701]
MAGTVAPRTPSSPWNAPRPDALVKDEGVQHGRIWRYIALLLAGNGCWMLLRRHRAPPLAWPPSTWTVVTVVADLLAAASLALILLGAGKSFAGLWAVSRGQVKKKQDGGRAGGARPAASRAAPGAASQVLKTPTSMQAGASRADRRSWGTPAYSRGATMSPLSPYDANAGSAARDPAQGLSPGTVPPGSAGRPSSAFSGAMHVQDLFQSVDAQASPLGLKLTPAARDTALPKFKRWQPRGKTEQRKRDGTLQPSTYEHYLRVLKEHGVTEREMTVWKQGLREWLAERVLAPLLDVVDGAHVSLNAAARACGKQTNFSPLAGGVTRDGIGRVEPGPGKDPEMALGLWGEAESALHAMGANAPQRAQVEACRDAALAYVRLSEVLAGKLVHSRNTEGVGFSRPPGGEGVVELLKPTPPPGYVLWRARELAEGVQLKNMVWNGGSNLPWEERPWTRATHPTDGALVLYLLACYLDAPGWSYSGSHCRPESGPLFLGAVPDTLPSTQRYAAILTGSGAPRQGRPSAVVAVPDLQVKEKMPPRPMYVLALDEQEGDKDQGNAPVWVLDGKDGLFDTLLLWLRHAQLHNAGMLGDLDLDATLGIDQVFRDRGAFPPRWTLQRVMGL